MLDKIYKQGWITMNNHIFKIEVPDGFDETDESYIAVRDSLFQQLNNLSEEVTVLLFRIPDDYDFLNNETYLHVVMTALREIVAEYAPNAYVIALQFDVVCTDSPDFIQNVSGFFQQSLSTEDIKSAVVGLLERTGLKSRVALPKIEIAN